MTFLLLGFVTGLSLIFAIGPQNVFVIEQGIKKQFVFLVCTICSISDLILIFLGIFLFEYFARYFSSFIELIFNILLLLFLLHFIYSKIKKKNEFVEVNRSIQQISFKNIILKTLGFTYLNPHVYSDTVFILGNLSKNFLLLDKLYFAFGASISSIIFFYSLGYMSSFFAKYIKKQNTWKYINIFIIIFMGILIIYIFYNTFKNVALY